MATLVIVTQGTLGDHLPYFELGKALSQRGHQVRMALNPAMLALATQAGLTAVACGVPLGEVEARHGAADWQHLDADHISAQLPHWQAFYRHDMPLAFAQLLAACAGADLLLCGYQRHSLGSLIRQKTGLPWLATSVMPALHCAAAINPFASHPATAQVLGQTLDEIAVSLGLQARWDNPARTGRALLAASPHFAQVNAANAGYQQTGFWFYADPHWQTWQADTALHGFLQRFPEPLVLSFSSLPLQDARTVLTLHVRAAAKLGRGLVVQRGWADFNATLLPDDCPTDAVFFADFIPHDWLFARASAVIHHGGIGTLARAVRNGCPMLVEPYGNDQFFNAKQVLVHQIGAVAHPQRLTLDGLVRLLTQKVLTADCRRHTQALGDKIRAENGLATACQLIEAWL